MDSEITDDYYIYVCLAMKGGVKNAIRMRKDTVSIKKKNHRKPQHKLQQFSLRKIENFQGKTQKCTLNIEPSNIIFQLWSWPNYKCLGSPSCILPS